MEESLNTKCEQLIHATKKIERENQELSAFIASKEQKGDGIDQELQRLHINNDEKRLALNADYGKAPQALQKWDSSWSGSDIPLPREEYHGSKDRHSEPRLTEPWLHGEATGGVTYVQKDPARRTDDGQTSSHLLNSQLRQQEFREISTKHRDPDTRFHEQEATATLRNEPRKVLRRSLSQTIQDLVRDNGMYQEMVRKLNGHIQNICHERTELEKKYQIKVEVCERLEEDNRALTALISNYSSRATLATDDDVEVLKEACRVYQEDFQTERSEREAAHAEKEKLKAELEKSKQDVKDLNEKVMLLLSMLGQHQPPSPLRKPTIPWDWNEPYRTSMQGYRQNFGRRNTFNYPSSSQPGDVIRRGNKVDLRPDLYAVVDDLDVKDNDFNSLNYHASRRKSLPL